MARRYHITTFGCQMNKADSERMAGVLETMGFGTGGFGPLQHLHNSG